MLYVTERAVFQLTKKGLTLIEIAPGIDLEQDVLNMMDFQPALDPNLSVMDLNLFSNRPMSLFEKAYRHA